MAFQLRCLCASAPTLFSLSALSLLPFSSPASASLLTPSPGPASPIAQPSLIAQAHPSLKPRSLMDKAADLFSKGDYPEAIAIWTQVLSTSPSRQIANQANMNRAKAYLVIGQPALALADLDSCRYEPAQVAQLAELWLMKGSALLQNNQYKEAVQAFAKSEALQPSNPIVFANRAVAYQSLGNIPAARNDLIAAIKLQPNLSNYFNYAVLERLSGNYQSCFAILSQIIAKSQPYPQLFVQRGLCAAALNRHDEAIADMLKVIKLDAGNVDAIQQVGLSLLVKNQKTAAKPYLLKASSLRLAKGQVDEYQRLLKILAGL